jgi:hypothetical protein
MDICLKWLCQKIIIQALLSYGLLFDDDILAAIADLKATILWPGLG